jgi:hypothetical protein
MPKPLIREDLVDAAAALLLCQHDSPLIGARYADVNDQDGWDIEANLQAARVAASAYLVACFDAAVTWNADDE